MTAETPPSPTVASKVCSFLKRGRSCGFTLTNNKFAAAATLISEGFAPPCRTLDDVGTTEIQINVKKNRKYMPHIMHTMLSMHSNKQLHHE